MNKHPGSGRVYKDDGSIVNFAELLNPNVDAIKNISITDVACLKGEMFSASILFDLTASASRDLGFVTPTDIDVIWFNDDIKGDVNYVSYKLYEDAIFTEVTEQEVININRQSTNVAKTKLYNDISGVDVTSAILLDVDATLGGSGSFGTSTGSSTKPRKGMILKRGTKHLIRTENTDSNDATVSVHSTFIEKDLAI